MSSPLVPLHAGADPLGIHPRLLLFALLVLAVATAVGLHLLVGTFGPSADDPDDPGTVDGSGE
jgi:hypothetical protein